MSHENDDEKLLDHNYDGIQELDNPLPAWWRYLFYISIVFAVIYIGYDIAVPSSQERVEAKLEAFRQAEEEAQLNASMTFSDSPEELEKGKAIFQQHCAACHTEDGGGLIGPNLTDNYWIHGGSLKAIFQVVRDGVPEKGMISWKSLLKHEEMLAVTSYVKSLKGTTPENPKAPEGELVEE